MHHDKAIHAPTRQSDWRQALAPGDVVLFRYPLAEEKAVERPKARPCLVLAICGAADAPRVVLAYGTTSKGRANVGHQIDVRRPADRAAAGLRKRSRFIGCRRMTEAADDPRFAIGPSASSPVIGRLAGNPADRLQVVLDHLHDEIEGDVGAGWHCLRTV
jgi:hypothetical protein